MEGRAIEALRQFEPYGAANPRYRIVELPSQAVLAHERGALAEALEQLRQAAALAEQLRLPGEAWTAQIALGELAIEQGDQPLACAPFGRAARILQDLAVQIADPTTCALMAYKAGMSRAARRYEAAVCAGRPSVERNAPTAPCAIDQVI